MQAWAQAETSKRLEHADTTARADTAQAFRQGDLLEASGKWEIHAGLGANTYLLIGKSTSDNESQFWLHCDQRKLVTIAVPLIELSGSDRLRSRTITIRSDTGLERGLSLVVFENFVAVAIDYEGASNNKVADFLDVLRASKAAFTISYGDKSFEYDVDGLRIAEAHFHDLCQRVGR